MIALASYSGQNRREFERHARNIVSDVSFQMYFPTDLDDDADQSTCHFIKHYQNSTTAAAHLRNMQTYRNRNKVIHECADIERLEVYGKASPELKDILSEEAYMYSVVYFGPSDIGVTRG